MQLAVQENLLVGHTISEKFERARMLGVQGIELDAAGLTARARNCGGDDGNRGAYRGGEHGTA